MNYRGLIHNNKPVESWRDRFEKAGGWNTIPNRGLFAKKADEKAELFVYDQIGRDFWDGSGITASDVVEQLKSFGDVKSIDIRINSPGGEVYEANAIYSQLNQHPAKKHVFIDGIAASAASYLAMVGDTISIAEHAQLMIHNAWGMAIGNADDMEQLAKVLRGLDESIRLVYQRRTGQPDAKIREWMEAETYFSGKDAVANGFATALVPAKSASVKDSAVALMKMRLAVARAK